MARKKDKQPSSQYRIKSAIVRCTSVYDGETFAAVWKTRSWFKKYNQEVEIRLAKIVCSDTMSSRFCFPRATAFLRRIEGKKVLIEYAQYPNGDIVKDEDGRILAMVFIRSFSRKNKNLGLEQVKLGNAGVHTPEHQKNLHYWSTEAYDQKFEAAYREAERQGRGPLHKGKLRTSKKQPRRRWLIYLGGFITFLMGFLVGLLTYALLVKSGYLQF